jgi:hypothetical protein
MNAARISQKTHCFRYKTSWIVLFKETVAVYPKNQAKQINTISKHGYSNTTAGGT